MRGLRVNAIADFCWLGWLALFYKSAGKVEAEAQSGFSLGSLKFSERPSLQQSQK